MNNSSSEDEQMPLPRKFKPQMPTIQQPSQNARSHKSKVQISIPKYLPSESSSSSSFSEDELPEAASAVVQQKSQKSQHPNMPKDVDYATIIGYRDIMRRKGKNLPKCVLDQMANEMKLAKSEYKRSLRRQANFLERSSDVNPNKASLNQNENIELSNDSVKNQKRPYRKSALNLKDGSAANKKTSRKNAKKILDRNKQIDENLPFDVDISDLKNIPICDSFYTNSSLNITNEEAQAIKDTFSAAEVNLINYELNLKSPLSEYVNFYDPLECQVLSEAQHSQMIAQNHDILGANYLIQSANEVIFYLISNYNFHQNFEGIRTVSA